jgi:hypothetical protein
MLTILKAFSHFVNDSKTPNQFFINPILQTHHMFENHLLLFQ